jgi:hypothetical protein
VAADGLRGFEIQCGRWCWAVGEAGGLRAWVPVWWRALVSGGRSVEADGLRASGFSVVASANVVRPVGGG